MNRMTVPEKLSVNKYELDEGNPHIEINNEICRSQCQIKACLTVCPAQVYSQQGDDIVADWAGCLECGTCRVACPHEALTWVYPRGSFGIVYRYG